MAKWLVIGVLAAAGTLLVVVLSQPNADPGKPCKRYCITSAEDESDDDVAVFKGRGWRPRRRVVAVYGTFCGGTECDDEGAISRIRTNRQGRFEFKLRGAPPKRGDRAARIASGDGPATFEQWKGRPFFSPLIRREPRQ
jgi:hypothetical protein